MLKQVLLGNVDPYYDEDYSRARLSSASGRPVVQKGMGFVIGDESSSESEEEEEEEEEEGEEGETSLGEGSVMSMLTSYFCPATGEGLVSMLTSYFCPATNEGSVSMLTSYFCPPTGEGLVSMLFCPATAGEGLFSEHAILPCYWWCGFSEHAILPCYWW